MRSEVTDDTVRVYADGPVLEQRCKRCGGRIVTTRNTDDNSTAIVHREPTCNPWRNALYLMRSCMTSSTLSARLGLDIAAPDTIDSEDDL